jgi:hypothetical protein
MRTGGEPEGRAVTLSRVRLGLAEMSRTSSGLGRKEDLEEAVAHLFDGSNLF